MDITGLPFGTYEDTLVVSDPAATNDPVKVPVTLTVASDLPLIAADSTFNIYILPTNSPQQFSRTFVVRNAGGGTLNFWVEENSTRITNVSVGSGTAPDTVTVQYKVTGQHGDVFRDTLWVYSNQAQNSPLMVINELRFYDTPPVLAALADTLSFTLYECAQGLDPVVFSAAFDVVDSAAGQIIQVFMTGSSDLFSLVMSGEFTPTSVVVVLDDSVAFAGVGTHLDTIVVTSYDAINRTDTVIVRIDILPGDQTPEMHLTDSSLVVPMRDIALPKLVDMFTVRNRFGGCMEWYIQEAIPWLVPVPDSGQVGQPVQAIIDVSTQSFGEHIDTLFVHAPSAGNSPVPVEARLQVWSLIGDWNWDGVVNISDLTAMIAYLYVTPGQPLPMPAFEVGDVNCDGIIDVADLTRLIEYLYITFQPLDCPIR